MTGKQKYAYYAMLAAAIYYAIASDPHTANTFLVGAMIVTAMDKS